MKKHLGSSITAYAAIVMPLFILFPLLFGISSLYSEVSVATVFLTLMCVGCSFSLIICLKNVRNQLYSFGNFSKEYVKITTLFSKPAILEYEKCKGCGIGFYTHGVLNSSLGTKMYFIYLSYDIFNESCRSKINLWKPSQTRIKVKFSKRLYDYLIEVLPQKQSKMLSRDYEKIIQSTKIKKS